MLLVRGCGWLVSAPRVFSVFFLSSCDSERICLDMAQVSLPHVPLQGGHVSGMGKGGPSMEVAAIPWPWAWVIHPLSGREREELRVRIDSTAGLGCFSINMSSYQQLPTVASPRLDVLGRAMGAGRLRVFLQRLRAQLGSQIWSPFAGLGELRGEEFAKTRALGRKPCVTG